MDNSTPDRTTAPASLLSQWWTLGAILADTRTAGRHAKVAWVIIDRYMRKHGHGRASTRYIAQATGLGTRHVARACRELVEWGYFDQHIKPGQAPAEYSPNWRTVSPMGHANDQDSTVSPMGHSTVSPMGHTNEICVSPMGHESCLHEPADKAGLNVSNAVASPPAADGLAATAPGEGFEEIWKAYKKHGNKAKAREAFAAINLDTFDVDIIVRRAASWAASAKPGQRRMPLEKWLAEEKFDEADRAVVPKAPKPAKAQDGGEHQSPPTPANDNLPIRRTVVAVRGGIMPDGRGAQYVRLCIVDREHASSGDDTGDWLTICVESPELAEQDQGQKELGSLIAALGLNSIDDTDELLHRAFDFVGHDDGAFSFHPIESEAANG